MKELLVISSAPLILKEGKYYAYSPYEREMQIWAKHSKEIQFCCPVWKEDKNLLISEVEFDIAKVIVLKEFDIKSISNSFRAFINSIYNAFIIINAIKKANHIHLRSPGNMSLLATMVLIFFPSKKKTAKYAGNWDPKSKQPFTYKLQRWILSNTFLTRNMQVLVYGEWPNPSKNIKSFFTATYSAAEIPDSKVQIPKRDLKKTVKFLFVGTLSKGKQPLYAIQLVEELVKKGKIIELELYGEGVLRKELENYIVENELYSIITLKGNQSKEAVLKAYQNSHFLILPSKSEGWPKVVAEAMFWGCIPIVSPVSCVPYMIENGKRGILLTEDIVQDVNSIINLLENNVESSQMREKAQKWSRQFTTDKFEEEIKKMLN